MATPVRTREPNRVRTREPKKHVIDEPASPEETQRLFGMTDERAATIDKWVAEALASEGRSAPEPASGEPARAPLRRVYEVWTRPEGREGRWHRREASGTFAKKRDADREATRLFVEYTGWLYEVRPRELEPSREPNRVRAPVRTEPKPKSK